MEKTKKTFTCLKAPSLWQQQQLPMPLVLMPAEEKKYLWNVGKNVMRALSIIVITMLEAGTIGQNNLRNSTWWLFASVYKLHNFPEKNWIMRTSHLPQSDSEDILNVTFEFSSSGIKGRPTNKIIFNETTSEVEKWKSRVFIRKHLISWLWRFHIFNEFSQQGSQSQ